MCVQYDQFYPPACSICNHLHNVCKIQHGSLICLKNLAEDPPLLSWGTHHLMNPVPKICIASILLNSALNWDFSPCFR